MKRHILQKPRPGRRNFFRNFFLAVFAILALIAMIFLLPGRRKVTEELPSETEAGITVPYVPEPAPYIPAPEAEPEGHDLAFTDDGNAGPEEKTTAFPGEREMPEDTDDDESSGNAAEKSSRAKRLRDAMKGVSGRGPVGDMSPERLSVYLPCVFPVHGCLTSKFGPRRSPFTGKMRFHGGMDIAAGTGTPVRAAADGVAIFGGRDGGYGLSVELVHIGGIVTRYAHLSKIIAVPGKIVRKGEVLGLVGSTGASTGPHLHYEVLVNGVRVNPRRYLTE